MSCKKTWYLPSFNNLERWKSNFSLTKHSSGTKNIVVMKHQFLGSNVQRNIRKQWGELVVSANCRLRVLTHRAFILINAFLGFNHHCVYANTRQVHKKIYIFDVAIDKLSIDTRLQQKYCDLRRSILEFIVFFKQLTSLKRIGTYRSTHYAL